MTKKIYLIIIISSIAIAIFGQNDSYPTKNINGKTYYIYQVKKSEGLYAISRKFGISQTDIVNANPHIHNGLKLGQEIYIPTKKTYEAATTKQQKRDFIQHNIQKKETLFGISRRYGVSQTEILKANPSLKDGLTKGAVINIPIAEKEEDTISATKQSTAPQFIQHNVQKKETLFGISKRYGVSQTKILKANPSLKDGLKESAIINIPIDKEVDNTTSEIKQSTLSHPKKEVSTTTHIVKKQETIYGISRLYGISITTLTQLNPQIANGLKIGDVLKVLNGTSEAINNQPNTTPTNNKQTAKQKDSNSIKIAYLLPFNLDKQNDATTQKFTEFYMGTLLALEKVKNYGMKIDVYTYDIEKTEKAVYNILNKKELQNIDVIVGPAYTAQIPIVADFAQRRKIPTIIPFSSNINYISTNPYIFQFNPDDQYSNLFWVTYLKKHQKSENIILVSNKQNDFLPNIQNDLTVANIHTNQISNTVFNSNMTKYLRSNKKNIVIFQTKNIDNVRHSLAALKALNSEFRIAVVAPYAWKGSQYDKPEMYYAAPFFKINERFNTRIYETEFERLFGKYHTDTAPRYDMLGYDLTSFLLSLLRKNGTELTGGKKTLSYSNGLQSNFKFKKIGNGGYINQQLFIIQDED